MGPFKEAGTPWHAAASGKRCLQEGGAGEVTGCLYVFSHKEMRHWSEGPSHPMLPLLCLFSTSPHKGLQTGFQLHGLMTAYDCCYDCALRIVFVILSPHAINNTVNATRILKHVLVLMTRELFLKNQRVYPADPLLPAPR